MVSDKETPYSQRLNASVIVWWGQVTLVGGSSPIIDSGVEAPSVLNGFILVMWPQKFAMEEEERTWFMT